MIRLERLCKTFAGGVEAVRDVSLHIPEGETFVLIGLSGCGKTTTLRMINRLIEPTGGAVFLGGPDVTHADPVKLRRGIGYVIQDIGLFPHMTVAANIGIVLRLGGVPRTRWTSRAAELLDLVGLPADEYLHRYPGELSGGQQQRVGVARALSADPPVLLMDEPFGALDPITREQLQAEFRSLEAHIQKTIVLVTHDIFEAVLLGDRIGIMAEGRLVQVATPEELLARPANQFVRKFLGRHRFQLQLSTADASQGTLDDGRADVLTVPAEMSAAQATAHLERHDLDAVVVEDNGSGVVGVLSAGELSRGGGAALTDLVAEEVPVLPEDASLLDVVRALNATQTTLVPVVNTEGRLTGVATRESAAAAVAAALGLQDGRESEQ